MWVQPRQELEKVLDHRRAKAANPTWQCKTAGREMLIRASGEPQTSRTWCHSGISSNRKLLFQGHLGSRHESARHQHNNGPEMLLCWEQSLAGRTNSALLSWGKDLGNVKSRQFLVPPVHELHPLSCAQPCGAGQGDALCPTGMAQG